MANSTRDEFRNEQEKYSSHLPYPFSPRQTGIFGGYAPKFGVLVVIVFVVKSAKIPTKPKEPC